MTQIALPKKTPVKAAVAGWVGTMLEYYDFAVYGTSAALVLNILFFSPELPQGISVLLAMATFAVGYFVRPLGSLILGPMGDRFGRKFVMLVTLFGIGGCTFLVGCLPTYSQVGALALVVKDVPPDSVAKGIPAVWRPLDRGASTAPGADGFWIDPAIHI